MKLFGIVVVVPLLALATAASAAPAPRPLDVGRAAGDLFDADDVARRPATRSRARRPRRRRRASAWWPASC